MTPDITAPVEAGRTSRSRLLRAFELGTSAALVAALAFVLFLAYGLVGNRWYHIIAIEGGSMEPTITRGDLILVTPPPSKLEPGMILVMTIDGKVVTHRLIAVNADGSLVTRGDANNTNDAWGDHPIQVDGQYVATIPWLGHILPVRNASGASFAMEATGTQRIEVGSWPTPPPDPTLPPIPTVPPDPTLEPTPTADPTTTPTDGAPLSATIRIEPDTINLSANGDITAFIGDLAAPHQMSEIERTSLMFCYDAQCVRSDGPAQLDGNGHAAVRLARAALADLIGADRGDLVLVVQGRLSGGEMFSGWTRNRVIGRATPNAVPADPPTAEPGTTAEPTLAPTAEPTAPPTPAPTTTPSPDPTPTPDPTAEPTPDPTPDATAEPTATPEWTPDPEI